MGVKIGMESTAFALSNERTKQQNDPPSNCMC